MIETALTRLILNASSAASPSDAASQRRVVLASFVGTAVEWYDFFLYGTAAALVLNQLFFPNFDPVAGQLAAFGTFAIGFFARPLGGAIFGHFGDRVGRKSMLVVTLLIMGVATFLIGLLPTYDAIGAWAPILLVILRFCQGLGVGGEWGGAVLMVAEHGGAGRRGYLASWVQAGVPVGLLLATGVYALCRRMPDEAFLSWGWRVPFLLGIALTGIGFFIRAKVFESPVFARAMEQAPPPRLPILDAIRHHPTEVLRAMGARLAENAFFYIFTVWVLSYGKTRWQIPESVLLGGVLAGSAIQLAAIPTFGALSDRLGRKPVYLGGVLFLMAFAWPFFLLVDTAQPALVWLAIIVGMIGHAAMYGPQAAFFSEMFGTRVRYSGASLGYQLASPFAGGLAPIIAAKLVSLSGGSAWPVAAYLMGMGVLTVIAVWSALETHRKEL